MAVNQHDFAADFPPDITGIKRLFICRISFIQHKQPCANKKLSLSYLQTFIYKKVCKATAAKFYLLKALIFVLFYSFQCCAQQSPDNYFPEQSEIDIIYSKEQPEGILFLVMEQDDEALYWVLPRVMHYTQQLREKWSDLAIVVLSHGDEMLSLTNDLKSLHNELHQAIKKLMTDYNVLFQVCGSYASFADIDVSEFPDYIDVVPFAPAEIETYRQMGFKMINLELTW